MLSSIQIPIWQVLVAMVGFPCAYIINSFSPWTRNLFGPRADVSQRLPFYTSIIVLHVITVSVIIWRVNALGYTAAAFGVNLVHALISGMLLILVGSILAFIKPTQRESAVKETGRSSLELLFPNTRLERLVYVLLSLSAGFCEEFIYRGFGLLALSGIPLNIVLAVSLTSVAFTFLHGRAAFSSKFVFWFGSGIVFCGIYIFSRNLLLVMVIHTVFDLMLLFRPINPVPAMAEIKF